MPRLPLNWIISLPLAAISAVGLWLSISLPGRVITWLEAETALAEAAAENHLLLSTAIFSWLSIAVFLITLIGSISGGIQATPTGLSRLRRVCFTLYGWSLITFWQIFSWTGKVLHLELPIGGVPLNAISLFWWRWDLAVPILTALCVIAAIHLWSWKRGTARAYGNDPGEDLAGDRFLEDVRTGGQDPRFRKSSVNSVFIHIFVILIIPFLLQLPGCVEDYRVPEGSGEPVVALVQMVKPEKKKKQKLALRPNSAIYFDVPELEDSEVLEQVKELTELTYKADPNARAGKMGAGGGKKGGWPDGMDKGKVRFIRLEYAGGRRWDDGLNDKSDADINFLREFNKLTGFKTARTGESHPVHYLKKYRAGYAPPFVYMTGDAGIKISDKDAGILREYLLGGGLLFADAGSPGFHRSFESFARKLFPNEALRVIADDDPIFQMPYAFPNGAPPLWHHGGMRAKGIKIQGRWVVFYHPGDMNDAWKTGHSGMKADLARESIQMGVNIVYYAFTQYLEQTREHRK